MLPIKNEGVLRVYAVRSVVNGKERFQKFVTIPLKRQDIMPGDFIKFKKVEII